MEEALMEMMEGPVNLPGSVNREILKQNTRHLPSSEVERILWNRVRYLYILYDSFNDPSPNSFRANGVEEGFHVNWGHTWVLYLPDRESSMSDDAVINRCGPSLELLHIANPGSAEFHISGFPNLRCFRLYSYDGYTRHTLFGIHGLHRLEELVLEESGWDDVLDVSAMSLLKRLRFRNTHSPADGIDQLSQLKSLSLECAWLSKPVAYSCLKSLETLRLSGYTEYGTHIRNLHALPNLKQLHIGWVNRRYHYDKDAEAAGVTLDVSTMPKLERLDISNSIVKQISGLHHPQKLRELSFCYGGIRQIPEGIRHLKHLEWLDLRGTHLESLPDWLPELGLPFDTNPTGHGICLYSTEIDGVDMSIFKQPQEVILQWFEARRKGSAVPLNEVKVVFLGDGEAGKTHTIARLLADGAKPTDENFDGKATPGIVIQDKEYELDGKKIQVHFWDFGGQEILHSMHRMFLTERTLYVVIINARDDTQDARARYWLHNIKSFAGSAPVLLVLNKIDQNPNASIDKPNLQKMYSGLKDVVRMSALEDDKEKFNAAFTTALLQQVQALGTLGTLWPRSWLKLKSGLEKMQTHYIHGGDYEDLCDGCGVEQNREELLHWFNDLGVSFCYGGSAKLEDYVILKPEWLTNAIYIILFNECTDTENGVIPHDAIYRMLKKPRNGQDPIRRVLKNVFYRPEEAEYVLDVIRKFRLSYKIREDAEFIPVLCQRESMTVAEEYENDPNALEFQMEFEYLPDNVIHRLMVEMRQDLDTQNVWRTGARFIQQGTGLSAVVRSEGDDLRIFVRSDSPLHLPNTYLHIIKGNIGQIIADMKLQKPYCEVIYKADGITEAFDYEDLIMAMQDGETTYRSKKLRRRIPIQNILNQSGRTAEVELDKLRTDIITACMQLQGNSQFWTATEDAWNTAVRDALRNMGYLVNDQTFQGISSGGKKSGELDLEIRRDARIPWTIYEALKIRDKSKTAWNAHLEKLLDNYNPSGLNYLFLVTYVDCGKDSFPEIWDAFSEHIKWFNPGSYERLPSSFSHISLADHNHSHYIRAARCTYDRSGSPTTVCHIFVRMGR